jgi:hypothetical protein
MRPDPETAIAPRSGWEARAVLAVAAEHFDGVTCPASDSWAIEAARREVERASAITADPHRLGRRDVGGCLAVLGAARHVARVPSPFRRRPRQTESASSICARAA